MILCNLGIECYCVDGTAGGGNHTWNVVKLGGEYYYVDLTWDNIDKFNDGSYFPNKAVHKYFLLTGAEMAKTHNPRNTPAAPPACNGTKYNYYRMNNSLLSSYHRTEVENLVNAQKNKKIFEMKFANASAYETAISDIAYIDISESFGESWHYSKDAKTLTIIIYL